MPLNLTVKQNSPGHTISDSVYFSLRKNIVNLNLKPGEPLNLKTIAEKLGVSRTPVREAFIQLEKEGLVDVIPQVGTSVSRIDLARVDEEKFIRASLEEKAMEEFVAKDREEALSRMKSNLQNQKDCVDRKDVLSFLELDDDFHGTVFLSIGKHMSWDLIRNMSGHYRRVRIMSLWDGKTLREVYTQHQAIFQGMAHRQKDVHDLVHDHFSRIVTVEQELLDAYPDYFRKVKEDDFLMRDFLSML